MRARWRRSSRCRWPGSIDCASSSLTPPIDFNLSRALIKPGLFRSSRRPRNSGTQPRTSLPPLPHPRTRHGSRPGDLPTSAAATGMHQRPLASTSGAIPRFWRARDACWHTRELSDESNPLSLGSRWGSVKLGVHVRVTVRGYSQGGGWGPSRGRPSSSSRDGTAGHSSRDQTHPKTVGKHLTNLPVPTHLPTHPPTHLPENPHPV